jgi:hypothetical protein
VSSFLTELSSQTFWNFVHEFLSFQAARCGYGGAVLDPERLCPFYSR